VDPPERSARAIRGMDTLVGDFAGVTGARIATLVLGLLTVVLTARILTPEGYAVIAYMTLGGTLIMFVAGGWSGAAVMRYGREELDRTASMRHSTWARAALTLPILVLVSALLPALKLGGVLPQEFGWTYLWLTVALGFFFVAGEQLQVVLDAAGRMRLSAAAAAARQALLVAGLAVIAVTGAGRSTLTVAWLTVAVAALLMLVLALALRGLALWPPRLDRVQLRRIFVFSAPLIAFAASQYGMRSVDIVVLRAYGTAGDVGIYAIAYQSYTMLQTLAITATIVLVPLFVSLREAGREELVGRYFERLVPQGIFVSSVLGGLLAALVVLAVPVVFGEDFRDAGPPLALLVAALVLFAIASLLAPILMLHERTRQTSVINVAALALNVVGDIVLVGVLDVGILGPAIATIATLVVIVAGYLVVARRDLGTTPVLSPMLALPLAAGMLPAVLLDGAGAAAVGLTGAAAAAALVLWRLALFSEQDADLVARLDLPVPIRSRAVAAISRLARG
jgi:O-antigen/teichoic acid export membrane protein